MSANDKEASKKIKEMCLAAMIDESSRTKEAPHFAVLAKALITQHTWALEPTGLRIKMQGWWETRCGDSKKRKAAKRAEDVAIAQNTPSKSEQECLITTCAIQQRAHAMSVEQARQEWATEMLQQFDQPKTNYIVEYNLKGPAEIARAQDAFRQQCMVFWKKIRPEN